MPGSPFHPPPRTLLPGALRTWLGAGLRGPMRGPRRRRRGACIFAFGLYGDFVLMLSAVRLLVREYGADQCVVVLGPNLADLAAAELPGVEQIVAPYAAGSLLREILPVWWRERKKFSVDRFDRLVCFNHHRSLYTEIVLSWVDAEKDFRHLPSTYPAKKTGWSGELMAHWRLAEQVLGRTIPQENIVPRLTSVTPGNDGRLLVYPLSSDGSRDLSPERVARILRLWRTRGRGPVVFGGSPATQPTLEKYAALARQAGCAGVQVETPAGSRGLLEHLAAAGAILCAESAAGHIGPAFDKPTVVCMDRRLYGYCQPWHPSARQRVFLSDVATDEEIAAALPAI